MLRRFMTADKLPSGSVTSYRLPSKFQGQMVIGKHIHNLPFFPLYPPSARFTYLPFRLSADRYGRQQR